MHFEDINRAVSRFRCFTASRMVAQPPVGIKITLSNHSRINDAVEITVEIKVEVTVEITVEITEESATKCV